MEEYIKALLQLIAIAFILYGVPFLVRLGWNQAENRTKKVCDMCFRDIKKFNEKLKGK